MNARFDRHLEIYAQNGKELAALKQTVFQLHEGIGDLTTAVQSLPSNFVTNERFTPVKAIAFGIVGAACLSVMGALLALVIK